MFKTSYCVAVSKGGTTLSLGGRSFSCFNLCARAGYFKFLNIGNQRYRFNQRHTQENREAQKRRENQLAFSPPSPTKVPTIPTRERFSFPKPIVILAVVVPNQPRSHLNTRLPSPVTTVVSRLPCFAGSASFCCVGGVCFGLTASKPLLRLLRRLKLSYKESRRVPRCVSIRCLCLLWRLFCLVA